MYIKRVELENIRCFDKFEIDFEKRGSSVLLLGDNGDGKSTILKSIAMGLCDQSSAAALFRELPGEFVRRRVDKEEAKTGDFATIKIDLATGGGVVYRIVTTITSLKTFERVTQKLYMTRGGGKPVEIDQDKDPYKFPWNHIFVSGYGPGIRVQGSADFQHYLAADAVYPLFKHDEPLQNPELVIRRLIEEESDRNENSKTKTENTKEVLNYVKSLLKDLLGLENKDQVLLTKTGIKVKGRWGISELGELGDGYRSTVTWVLDLLSWWFLNIDNNVKWKIDDIIGIVLVDEIEQHLHPRWQLEIMQRLQDAFSKIQFIATSHSPLVVSGCKDCIIRKVSSSSDEISDAYGWRAEDVYRELLDLPSSINPEIKKKMDRFRKLDLESLSKKISNPKKKEMRSLRRELEMQMYKSDPTILSLKLRNIHSIVKKEK